MSYFKAFFATSKSAFSTKSMPSTSHSKLGGTVSTTLVDKWWEQASTDCSMDRGNGQMELFDCKRKKHRYDYMAAKDFDAKQHMAISQYITRNTWSCRNREILPQIEGNNLFRIRSLSFWTNKHMP